MAAIALNRSRAAPASRRASQVKPQVRTDMASGRGPPSLKTVGTFRRWDCINAGQRKRSRSAGSQPARPFSRPQPPADRRQSAGLFADSPGIHYRDRLRAGGRRIRTLGPGTRARDEPLRPSFRLSTMPLMARERANDASNLRRSSAADHSVALFPTDWIAASSSRQRGRRLGSLAIRISGKTDKREVGRWYRRYVGTIRRDFLLRPDRSR